MTTKYYLLIILLSIVGITSAQINDTLSFGDTNSEKGHGLIASNTKILAGNLGQSARQCLPPATSSIYGGNLTFTFKVDSVKRNYFTLKLWGGDDQVLTTTGRLYLYAVDKGISYQVGYRHEGDYTPLNCVGAKQPLPGRFFYTTTLLPLSFTKGKTVVTLKIISTGYLYGLGTGAPPNGNYQLYMTKPSRAIYKAYSHTDPYLDISNEVQGSTPTTTVMPTPAISVMNKGGTYYTQVNNRITNRLTTATNTSLFTTTDVEYLAKSYFVVGMNGYNNSAVVTKVIALLDAFATDYYADNTAVYAGGNEGWGGRFGHLGYAIYLLRTQLQNVFDATVNYGTDGGTKTHRQAWGDMLVASRDFGRTNRRFITNQAILGDESIYKANKGLLALSDSRAFPEEIAQRYLTESVGITPFLSSDDTVNNTSTLLAGSNYYQVTQKGLSREFGYVGLAYGEMQRHAAHYYRYTGNEIFRQQAIKMLKARIPFRRQAVQASGTNYYRGMEGIGLLAWRGRSEVDGDYANDFAYGDQTGNAGPLIVAAATMDPDCIAYAKQCLADNQFFVCLTNALAIIPEGLDIFSDYALIAKAADNGKRLPMTDGQPDFVWSDEENGIAAMKKGDEKLWIEPYWQSKAQSAINGIARFHYSTPTYDQYGVLETTPFFTYAGQYITRPNYVDGMGGTTYMPPDKPINIYANEKLPVAANGFMTPPTPISNTYYQPLIGKADAYALRFGKFLIGMNYRSNNFTLQVPKGLVSATEISSGTIITNNVAIAPVSTKVLYLDKYIDSAPVPATPLLLFISTIKGTKVTLNWRDASGANTYSIKRSTTSGGPYSVIKSLVVDTTIVDNSITAGTTYFYVVSAINANGESYNSMEVSTAGFKNKSPILTNTGVDTAYLGIPYFYTLSALFSPSSYSVSNLPSGLNLNKFNGIISGTPNMAGTYLIPITATNSVGTGKSTFTLVIINPNKPVLNATDTAKAYMSVPFSYQIGGTNSPFSYTALSLPASLTIDTVKGVISGVPLKIDTIRLSIQATNVSGSASATLVIIVSKPPVPVVISPASAHGVVGQTFSFAINATNSPYFFKSSTLPLGLKLDTTTGLITGIPTIAATTSVIVYAINNGGTGKATISFIIPSAPPSPWVDEDLGTATNGYATYDVPTERYTVAGSGNNIGSTIDGFNYLYQPISCSTATSIVARLVSRQFGANAGGNPADKVGLMIRESNATNSKHFSVFVDGQRNAYSLARTTTGGGTSTVGTSIALDIPVWLRIDRNGSDFTAYASLDTTVWETIGTNTFMMNNNMLFGMAVCSRQSNLDVSVFDSVQITSDCSLLPLRVVNYQAEWKKDNIQLSWTALNEQNNHSFLVLHSIDGIHFDQIATINSLGDGTHSYKWIDNMPDKGNNYYKLVEVDNLGSSQELGIRFVRWIGNVAMWSIYPNPIVGSNCIVKSTVIINRLVDLKLFDLAGKKVWSAKKLMDSNTLSVSFDSSVSKGVYWLQLDNDKLMKVIIN